MWGEPEIRAGAQGAICGKGFGLHDIQAGACQSMRRESADECGLVQGISASQIRDCGVWGEQREAVCVQEVICQGAPWKDQEDVVGMRKEFI